MNIEDRVKHIRGVEQAIMEPRTNTLVVFYSMEIVQKDDVKHSVIDAVRRARAGQVVQTVRLIGSEWLR